MQSEQPPRQNLGEDFETEPVESNEDGTEERDEKSEEQAEDGPKLTMPKDPALVTKLEDKLLDYRTRLDTLREENPFKAPESFTDTNYKIAVLERLLAEGEVDTQQLSRELNEKYGGLDVKVFNNACAVINDYTETGGDSVRGGTGLR